MKPCPTCAGLVDDDANFCPQCGERMLAEPPPPKPVIVYDPAPRVPAWLPWALAVLAGLVVLATGAALVLQDDPPQAQPATPSAPPPPEEPEAAPPPRDVLAATGTTRLRINVAGCEGCLIDLLPTSGAGRTATVVGGSAEFDLPTAATLGLAVAVAHPQEFGSDGGPNVAVLRPVGTEAGSAVPVSAIVDAGGAGVCWAGTLNSGGRMDLLVEPFANATPGGGLRVWASPALAVIGPAVAPADDGTVEADATSTCVAAVAAVAG